MSALQSLPLRGVRVLEFEGVGPGPLAGRMLAGMGADVTLVVRPLDPALRHRIAPMADSPLRDGKQLRILNLKRGEDLEEALRLVEGSDVLLEANRPGVMERLGLGPVECLTRNPKLVYGRMTGWGQHGLLAQAAGHDLNYVALTGLLSLSAAPGQPPRITPTVGESAGALGLAFGIACALVDLRGGGTGRVVDGAVTDVMSMLGTLIHWVRAFGNIDTEGPSPLHDSPYYDVYACADGRFASVAAVEPQFYALLLDKLGIADIDLSKQNDRTTWPATKARIAARFRERTLAHWCESMEGTDACFAPVLTIAEALEHPHNVARRVFEPTSLGRLFPAVAPRFIDVPRP
jgi:alpha-methylacyl-CoA racemase